MCTVARACTVVHAVMQCWLVSNSRVTQRYPNTACRLCESVSMTGFSGYSVCFYESVWLVTHCMLYVCDWLSQHVVKRA